MNLSMSIVNIYLYTKYVFFASNDANNLSWPRGKNPEIKNSFRIQKFLKKNSLGKPVSHDKLYLLNYLILK